MSQHRFSLLKFVSIIIALALIFSIASCAQPAPAQEQIPTPVATSDVASINMPSTPVAIATEPVPTAAAALSVAQNPTVKIQMAGDILLHTLLRESAKLPGGGYDYRPYWKEIAPYIDGDLTICNMEGPVDARGNNSDLSTYPQFNVPLEILDTLKYAGFNTLITANNHAYDKGFDGLAATRKNIENKGFNVTGTNISQEQYDDYLIIDCNGIKIGIIAYSEIDNGLGGLIPADKRPFAMRRFSIGTTDVNNMAADMAACRKAGADMIILSLHWGTEYANAPSKRQIEMARALAENGADVVMGNHSHCVQPMEWVQTARGSRLIIYSLGNFFVDQSALTPPTPRTQYGMLVNVTAELINGKLSLDAGFLPTFMRKYTKDDKITYSLLPAQTHLDVAQAAFDHVTNIAGGDVRLFEAAPLNVKVLVNGKSVEFDAYTVNNRTWFRIADIALQLADTPKRFSVSWKRGEGAIILESGGKQSGTMAKKATATTIPVETRAKVYLDGNELPLKAYTIEGHTYFLLKDVAAVFDFSVSWNNSTKTISIDTDKPYN